MAQQKAQAQLTIIDTNDIQRMYVVYAKSTSNNTAPSAAASTWTESISSAPGSGNYIWQRTVVEQSGTHALSYGNPVCVTGPAGANARNITSVTPYYYLSTSNSTQTGGSWSTTPQTYPSSGTYYYWTKTITAYDSGNSTESTAVLDMIITNAAKDARDANLTAATANSIAQHANEDAQGAMSQAAANMQIITRLWYAKANSTAPSAPSAHVTTASATTYNSWNTIRPNSNDSYSYYFYCDETCTGGGVYSWSVVTLDTSNLSQYQIGLLNTQVKNFWWDSSGAHIASGIGGNNVTKGTISTYGYNTLIALDGISFKYNGAKVVNLNSTTPSLDFYKPPTISGSTVTEGAKTISLTGSALKFYGSSTSTADVELNSNGLNITNGFIQLGGTEASGTASGNIRLANTDFSRDINGISRDYLRLAIGSNFGVKNDGTLYASNANVSGTIIVGDEEASNIYTKDEVDSSQADLDQKTMDTLDNLDTRINALDESVSEVTTTLQNTVTQQELGNMTSFVNQYLGDNGAMKIVNQGLQISQGDFSVLITGDRIVFMQGGQSVAYLTNQKLYISKTEVLQQQIMGNFAWTIRDGRLTLMKVR